MKIAQYNDMMSYLTRPEFSGGSGKKPTTIEELKKSGKITTLDKVERPEKAKLLEAIRNFEIRHGFRKKNDAGGLQIVEPSKSMQVDTTTKGLPDPLEEFKKQADMFLQASFASTNKDYFNSLIEQEYNKALEAGVQPQEALSFLKERSQMYRTLAEEGRRQGEPAILGPSYGRDNKAIGGGVVEGEDLGTREGFNNISKSEASFKVYEDKFGKKLLDEMAQEKYGKNFRDLDKNNQLKFFKSQLNKYEDFIKENKRYPNPTEAYNIGLTQGGKKSSILTDEVKTKIKNIYTSGEGGSTYISKKLAEEGINIDDSTIRRFITAEEEAGNIVRPTKFKTQEPDPDLPKDRYNKIRKVTERDLKGFTVGRSGTEVLAPEGSKYKITFNIPRSTETTKIPPEYQGTQYYKTKDQANKAIAGYKKFSKDLIRQAKANKGLREIILEEISDTDVEREIVTMKEGTDLATAHRLSYKQVKKLGELYNILNLGVEAPGINSGAIRKFENKLDNLYKEQNNLIRTAKRSTNKGLEIPKNIQKRIDNVNKEISTVVDLTNQRVQGILVDAKTLKPYTYGINYIKTYGMGFLENKPVKDITNEDLKVIEDNLKFQIAREKKLAKGTESFLRDRQDLLKYTKELSEPNWINKIPARLKPIALGTGLLIAGTTASRAGETNQEDKSLIEEYPLLTGAAAAATPLATKTGRKIYGALAKPLLKAFGSVPAATYFAGKELSKEDPNYAIAGADLLLPELGKRVAGSGTGIMSNIGRFLTNPIGRLARGFTPLGIGLQGVELVNQAMKEQKRINEMRENDPEAYQQFIAEQEDMMRESAAYGGRMGFADGPEDPSKRKFMKIMGGLASLPIIGRFFDVAKEAAPVLDAVKTEVAKGKPEWFDLLVNKVIRIGENVTERFATKEREIVHKADIGENETVYVYQELDTGTVRVEYENPDNMGGDSVNLVYKKELPDEGNPNPSPEFYATELEPRGIRTGPDDYDVEFDGENIAENVDELMSDTGRLEYFATGKTDMKKIEKSNEKRKKVKAMNESTLEQAEYLESKYGPGDDYYDD